MHVRRIRSMVAAGMVGILAAGAGVLATESTASAVAAHGIQFVARTKVFDRDVLPDVQAPASLAPGLYLMAASGLQDGGAYLVPCGSSPSGPAAIAWVAEEVLTNLVRVGATPAGGWCVTVRSSARAAISLESVATETASASAPEYVKVPSAQPKLTFTIPSGGTLNNLSVASYGVPSNAVGVFFLVNLVDPGSVTFYPCPTTRPDTSSITSTLGLVTSAVAMPLGSGQQPCIYAHSPAGADVEVEVTVTGFLDPTGTATTAGPTIEAYDLSIEPPPAFRPVTPTRLFDTRPAVGGQGPVAGGTAYRLELANFEPSDARTTAVVMNVTVTEPQAAGFVTVYPCSDTQPTASNLNYVANETVPNQVTVDVGTEDAVCFFSKSTTHLVADLAGWYVSGTGSTFNPQAPKRLFDTRRATGAKPLAAGTTFVYDLSADVGASTDAVTMNVTVTEPVADGFLTVYPCDAERPTASNLNYVARQTVPNLVTVRVGTDHKVCFFAKSTLHLLADLAGAYSPSAGSGLFAITPARALDTRDPGQAKLGDGATTQVDIAQGGTGAMLNVTITDPEGDGFATVYPCGASVPEASNLNYVTNQTVPNAVAVQLDAAGKVCIFTKRAAHVVVDVAGVFADTPTVNSEPITMDT